MACGIQKFKMTDSQVNRWCKDGCSVDCEKLLCKKFEFLEGEFSIFQLIGKKFENLEKLVCDLLCMGCSDPTIIDSDEKKILSRGYFVTSNDEGELYKITLSISGLFLEVIDIKEEVK